MLFDNKFASDKNNLIPKKQLRSAYCKVKYTDKISLTQTLKLQVACYIYCFIKVPTAAYITC